MSESSVRVQFKLDAPVPELSFLEASLGGRHGLHGTAAFPLDAAGWLGLDIGKLVNVNCILLEECQ